MKLKIVYLEEYKQRGRESERECARARARAYALDNEIIILRSQSFA